MVFYLTTHTVTLVSNEEHHLRVGFLRDSIASCHRDYPRFSQPYAPAISLMNLARCIYRGYAGQNLGRNRVIQLRGLAVFPSYHQPHDDRSGYGLEANHGRFFLECSDEVPVVNMQQPNPEFYICYAATMSENNH